MGLGRTRNCTRKLSALRQSESFPSQPRILVGLACLVNALVLFYVLSQSAKTTFLLANGNFQFFIEATHAIKISGTEQFKQKRAHLREITEDVFSFGKQALVFGTFDHKSLLPQQRCLVSSKPRRFTEDGGNTRADDASRNIRYTPIACEARTDIESPVRGFLPLFPRLQH